MSDENRADCKCRCVECRSAKKTITNLKRRIREIRERLPTPFVGTFDAFDLSAIERLCDLKDPYPKPRNDHPGPATNTGTTYPLPHGLPPRVIRCRHCKRPFTDHNPPCAESISARDALSATHAAQEAP